MKQIKQEHSFEDIIQTAIEQCNGEKCSVIIVLSYYTYTNFIANNINSFATVFHLDNFLDIRHTKSQTVIRFKNGSMLYIVDIHIFPMCGRRCDYALIEGCLSNELKILVGAMTIRYTSFKLTNDMVDDCIDARENVVQEFTITTKQNNI